MANEEHLAKLSEGVEAWNAWRFDNWMNSLESPADLSGANLEGANLIGANFAGANLADTDLSWADLRGANLAIAGLAMVNLFGADLSGADLREAKLHKADLSGADLSGADLSMASLQWANLHWANLHWANLSGANLSGVGLAEANLGEANLAYTTLANVNLSECKGLETVRHNGPSSLGIDTILKSGGHIPDVFLRGCGVPEDMIEYIHSIAGAIQFYSCFISYSSKDQEFTERLHADLQAKGLRIWFAPEDIKGGRKTHEQITEAIRLYDKLLLVLSPASMASEWVKTEIYHARQDEVRNDKRKLFPIGLVPFEDIRQWSAFDADVGKDMAREVREYHIPDFSNWKDHDAYQKAFDRLLRDLKASEDKKGAE